MLRRRALLLAVGLSAVAVPQGPARAESAVSLAIPNLEGAIAADTYDTEGERVGGADLSIEHLANGNVVLRSRSGYEGSARTELFAELEPTGDGVHLRPLTQRTESHDEQGRSLGLMTIDHRRRIAHATGVQHRDVELAEALDGVVDESFNHRLVGCAPLIERGTLADPQFGKAALALRSRADRRGDPKTQRPISPTKEAK